METSILSLLKMPVTICCFCWKPTFSVQIILCGRCDDPHDTTHEAGCGVSSGATLLQKDSSGQNGAVEPSSSISEKEVEDQVVGVVGEYFSLKDKREVDARLAVSISVVGLLSLNLYSLMIGAADTCHILHCSFTLGFSVHFNMVTYIADNTPNLVVCSMR